MNRVGYAAVLLLLTFVTMPALSKAARAQNVDKTQRWIALPDSRYWPVKVTDISLGGQKVEPLRAFGREGDWLKGLAVTLTNQTGRTIVSASFGLRFPQTAETGDLMGGYPIDFGTPRMAALRGERTVAVTPKESFTLTLDDSDYQKLKAFIEQRQPITALTQVHLSIFFILFDDGTAWSGGQYRIKGPNDRNDPDRWAEAPAKERNITFDHFSNEPIEIASITANGKYVKSGESFGSDDWFRFFEVTFRNVSDKTITYISILIVFPETANGGPVKAHDMLFGVNPFAKQFDEFDKRSLPPGGWGSVTLLPEDQQRLKDLLSPQEINALTSAKLRILVVYFDDGMQWSAGTMFQPDPARPGKFIPAADKPAP